MRCSPARWPARRAGAEVVELADYMAARGARPPERAVLLTDFKADLNAYLAATPAPCATRTLAELIAFNRASPRELALFGQDLFEAAEATAGLDDPGYLAARAAGLAAAGADGIDRLCAEHRLDALIAPSYGPAWRIDVGAGDHGSGRISALAAIAGYPHLTVPMGRRAPCRSASRSWARPGATRRCWRSATRSRRPPRRAGRRPTGPRWRPSPPLKPRRGQRWSEPWNSRSTRTATSPSCR